MTDPLWLIVLASGACIISILLYSSYHPQSARQLIAAALSFGFPIHWLTQSEVHLLVVKLPESTSASKKFIFEAKFGSEAPTFFAFCTALSTTGAETSERVGVLSGSKSLALSTTAAPASCGEIRVSSGSDGRAADTEDREAVDEVATTGSGFEITGGIVTVTGGEVVWGVGAESGTKAGGALITGSDAGAAFVTGS